MPIPRKHRQGSLTVYLGALRRGPRKPKKRKPEGGELVPVEPDKPKTLSGGAAAALEFDD